MKEARDAYVMNNRNEALAVEELMERKHQYDKREKKREKKRLKKAAEREEDERIGNMTLTEKKNAVALASMDGAGGKKKKKKSFSAPTKPPKAPSAAEFKSSERRPPPPEEETKQSAGSVEKGKKSTGGTLQSRKAKATSKPEPKPEVKPEVKPEREEEEEEEEKDDTIPRIGQRAKLGEKKLSIAEDMHIPSFKPKAVAVESDKKPSKPKEAPTSDPSRDRTAGGRSSTEMHEEMRKGWADDAGSDSDSDGEGEIEAERLTRKDSMHATQEDATDLAALEAMLG